jgi:ribonucleoside-diphosphate reductase beta chain
MTTITINDEKMERKKLFNPEGESDPFKLGFIGANTNNLLQLAKTKYPQMRKLYESQMFQNWMPQRISLVEDKVQYYESLNNAERRFLNKLLSFLIFLDSLQVNHLSSMLQYVTEPVLSTCLTEQQRFEALHSYSYTYILESIVSPAEIDEIMYEWKDDSIMYKRNKFITELYENFYSSPTKGSFLSMLFANFLLESIYFYSGFVGVHLLGRKGVMLGTDEIITLIQKDELLHIGIFMQLIKIFKDENLDEYEQNKKIFEPMMRTAVEQEIQFGQHITDNQILGTNNKKIEQYIKYLSNTRMSTLSAVVGDRSIKPLYPEIKDNPMKWAEKYDENGFANNNFFENNVTDYEQGDSLSWE